MTYQETTLPSGLRVASQVLPSVETVAVAVAVGVGARYEQDEQNGISHLLEHMAFKGTGTRSARAIAELFDDIGGQSNAYTSMEQTVYYARVMKENLASAVDILGDILINSTFEPQELAREQQVILQEIAMQQDTPDDLVYDMFTLAAYPDQPLGRSILGTPDLVSGYTRKDLQDYLEAHYHTERMSVCAAGNVRHEEFVSYVAEYFDGIKTGAAVAAPDGVYQGGEIRREDDLEQLHIVLGCKGISYYDPDYYASQLLSTILGGGMSSRLFQEIREKRGLVYHVSSSPSAYSDTGLFAVYAGLSGDKADEFIPVVCDELQKIQNGVTAAELARAKNQYRAGLLSARESSASVAEWIARHLTLYGRYKMADEIIGIIQAITEEDLRRVAKRLFNGAEISLAALGPIGRVEAFQTTQTRFAA